MVSESSSIKYTKLFINNEFVDAASKKTFPSFNPCNGQKIADVAEAAKEDVDKAVAAAKAAFSRNSEWRKMDASVRGKLINQLADLLQRDLKELARLETLDNGKPLSDSEFDIQCSVDVLRYYAGYCDKVHGHTIPSDGDFFTLTRKEPIGVVGQIIPWNYPLMMLAWKWGPALAAGCTLVLKPAELTPLTALAAAALAREAGFPAGVINVVPGYGPTAGAALALHGDVSKVAFTGSTQVGKKIMEYAAQSNLKRVSLELGGKSPLVVFDDVDLDEAVEIAHNAIFTNHGQNCCAGSRTFVQSGIYDAFVKKAVEKARARKVGDPFDASVQQGPQIDKPSLDKILRLVASGKEQGAKLETGGAQIGTEGYFVQPTVFSNVTDQMSIAKEEIFGPVQTILKFDTLEEVIERANDTSYGLASGVLTKDVNTALVFAQAVQAGSVWVNCYDAITPQTPFGGYKMSGIGREMGPDSVEPYLETKTISIKVPTKV
jgi:aldehyde dehydrogenase (NAD+)